MYTPNDGYYVLRLNPAQAQAVSRACEFFARVVCGQFSEVAWHAGFHQKPSAHSTEDYDQAVTLLYQARALLFPELGTAQGYHYGVGKIDRSDVCWDIHQVLRHAIWKHERADDKIDFCSVDAKQPMRWGSEPLCSAEFVHGKPGIRSVKE